VAARVLGGRAPKVDHVEDREHRHPSPGGVPQSKLRVDACVRLRSVMFSSREMQPESASSEELHDYPGGYAIDRRGAGRQFQSDFLEFFARCHGSVPLFVYVPLILWMFWLTATRTDLSFAAAAGLTLAGVLVWTFAEYWLHRVVFH